MTSDSQPSSDNPGIAGFLLLGAIVCYWLVLIYYLGAQWSVYEQYHYGWAVPFLCAYLLWRRTGGGGQRTEDREQRAELHLPSSIFYLLLAFVALLYAPTRFLHEANPIWRLTSFLWALEVIGLTLLTLRMVWGQGAGGRGQRSEVRGRRATSGGGSFQLSAFSISDFAFPICFFLVAVPWPSGLESLVTQSLMRLNVAATVELLGIFGVPAVQHGNVIEVGKGVVGIDEACSGIRSLQATLMISLFLGELYRLRLSRRLGLVALGFVLAFAFNVGRTLLLTGIASARGARAAASWHDPAGITILVGCFLCLWGLAACFGRKQRGAGGPSGETEAGDQRSEFGGQGLAPGSESAGPDGVSGAASLGPRSPSSIRRLRGVSIALGVWFLLVEGGTQFWYRWHEGGASDQTKWSVQWPEQLEAFKAVAVPAGIRGQFRYDQGTEGRWQDRNGNQWQLYYFRWFPARSLHKRVAVQLAKTHGPERCLPAAGMSLQAYLGTVTVPVGTMELVLQHYIFKADGRPFNVFYGIYEDASGSTELANRRKDCASRVAAALAGSRNDGQRFLEAAVFGCERPEDARNALRGELARLIRVEANSLPPVVP